MKFENDFNNLKNLFCYINGTLQPVLINSILPTRGDLIKTVEVKPPTGKIQDCIKMLFPTLFIWHFSMSEELRYYINLRDKFNQSIFF